MRFDIVDIGLPVYILIFYALGKPSSNTEFYVVVFFIATAVQDSAASLSVGSLEILSASIFLIYGITLLELVVSQP